MRRESTQAMWKACHKAWEGGSCAKPMGSSPALQSKSLERGEEKAVSCSFPEGGERQGKEYYVKEGKLMD